MIHFDPDTYRAVYAGQSVQLLPKEFALLRYLYEHAERSFSRDELLDAVWPLEAPGDRTVDDHIYRVRKKLAPWSHLLRVDTIRGQGYKLTRTNARLRENPLLQDEHFASDVNRMFAKYHGMGMGAAMRLLSANRDVLGLPGDPFYDAYVRFVGGDFSWLLETNGIDRWQQAVYAAFIHASIQFDPAASLRCFERLIAKGDELTPTWLTDLKLNAVYLYLEAGMTERARSLLEEIRPEIEEMGSPSFSALFLLKEMFLALEEGRPAAAAAKLEECGDLLARHPIRREKGAYLVAKGLYLYRQGNPAQGRLAVDEGIETTRQTQFVPHLLVHLKLVLLHLGKYAPDDDALRKYRGQWNALAEQYQFDALLGKTNRLLAALL